MTGEDARCHEFVCADCGRVVFSAAGRKPPPPGRCATCEWIAEHVDPMDYADVREALGIEAR